MVVVLIFDILMADDPDIQNGHTEIRAEMRRMIAGESVPYDGALKIWGEAMRLTPQSREVMWPLWLIWGALTDRVETQSHDDEETSREIMRAAKAWLALDIDDEAERKAYLDRWVYEEGLGYHRED